MAAGKCSDYSKHLYKLQNPLTAITIAAQQIANASRLLTVK
jgi:hypothetical protein